jgi:nicotinic acid phosphoribosyltransferase
MYPATIADWLYQLNMLQAYLTMVMDTVVFEFFVCRFPARRGFMAAGLEQASTFSKTRSSRMDIDCPAKLSVFGSASDYLASLRYWRCRCHAGSHFR